MRGASVAALTLAVALAPGLSRADAINPPHVECPPGSVQDSSHRGEACVATRCESDADCKRFVEQGSRGTWSCEETPLCVEHMVGDPSWHGPRTQDLGRRACVTQEHCVRPEVCEVARRCVREAPPKLPSAGGAEPRSGCGCGMEPTSAAASWLGFAIAAVAWSRRTLRRARAANRRA